MKNILQALTLKLEFVNCPMCKKISFFVLITNKASQYLTRLYRSKELSIIVNLTSSWSKCIFLMNMEIEYQNDILLENGAILMARDFV